MGQAEEPAAVLRAEVLLTDRWLRLWSQHEDVVGMVDTELPDHVTDPDASGLMADLLQQIDCLQPEDIAETVAFIASLPRHVNLTEITVLPTEQAI
ncbi:hypothetical protein [Streptomyces caelestis]|uniref:hypothetical protein n=1 Tax=Streptomyces caelestis TaxID=36816 RepID=UPI003663F3D9